MRKNLFFFLTTLLISNCAPIQKKGYQLSSKDLSAVEKKLDYARFIQDFDAKALVRGERGAIEWLFAGHYSQTSAIIGFLN